MARAWWFNIAAVAVVVALAAPLCSAQLRTAEDAINKDRSLRQASTRNAVVKPKWGFFGTIFHLILEQVNDTKSAYNQVSDLVNNQFADDSVVTKPPESNNGTTETPKISRAEFLKILDRNLKGLARLRSLEWREARKDSQANLREYKEQIFSGKEHRSGR